MPVPFILRAISHEAIYGQPVQGNLQEERAFTFECSPYLLVDHKTLLKKITCVLPK